MATRPFAAFKPVLTTPFVVCTIAFVNGVSVGTTLLTVLTAPFTIPCAAPPAALRIFLVPRFIVFSKLPIPRWPRPRIPLPP